MGDYASGNTTRENVMWSPTTDVVSLTVSSLPYGGRSNPTFIVIPKIVSTSRLEITYGGRPPSVDETTFVGTPLRYLIL